MTSARRLKLGLDMTPKVLYCSLLAPVMLFPEFGLSGPSLDPSFDPPRGDLVLDDLEGRETAGCAVAIQADGEMLVATDGSDPELMSHQLVVG